MVLVEIIDKPLYDVFINNCINAKTSIKLCSPFVKADIIDDIFKFKQNDVDISLITNVNLMSFCRKASDINGLEKLITANEKVFTFSRLHAKFYIFDDRFSIITSANLTSSGLKRNYEYGIITDNFDLVSTSVLDYNNLCLNELTGEIKRTHINKINNILNDLPTVPKLRIPKLNLDFSDNDDIFNDDKMVIINNLSGWKRAVFCEVDKLQGQIFTTKNFDSIIPNLIETYPNNHTISEKIRQQLQYLRDLGLIQFVSRGIYKKLWI